MFEGWRLAAAAWWVFVVPLILAVTGAVVAVRFQSGHTEVLLIALAAGICGVGAALVATKFLRVTKAGGTDRPVDADRGIGNNEK